MNNQREAIYKRRRHALFGDRLKLDILNMFHEVVAGLVNEYHDGRLRGFRMDLFRKLSTECPVDEEGSATPSPRHHRPGVRSGDGPLPAAWSADRAAGPCQPISVFLNQGAQYEGKHHRGAHHRRHAHHAWWPIRRKSYKSEGAELIASIEKYITLAIIDNDNDAGIMNSGATQNAAYRAEGPLPHLQAGELQPVQGHGGKRVNEQVATSWPRQARAEPNVQQVWSCVPSSNSCRPAGSEVGWRRTSSGGRQGGFPPPPAPPQEPRSSAPA